MNIKLPDFKVKPQLYLCGVDNDLAYYNNTIYRVLSEGGYDEVNLSVGDYVVPAFNGFILIGNDSLNVITPEVREFLNVLVEEVNYQVNIEIV